MKLIFKTAIALVISASCSTALFADVEKASSQSVYVKTRSVSYADLDLVNPVDAKVLIDRIHGSTKKVCRSVNAYSGLQEGKQKSLCMSESYKNAILVINSTKSIDVEAIAASSSMNREVVVAD